MSDSNTGGKPCANCEKSLPATPDFFHRNKNRPDGLTDLCKECAKAKSRRWHSENKDRALARSKEWHAAYPEAISQHKARYRANNREKLRAAAAEWREKNREHHRLLNRFYHEANKDTINAAHRERYAANIEHEHRRGALYRAVHPEERRQQKLLRRLRLQAAPGSHTTAQLSQQRKLQNDRCWYCGRELRGSGHNDHMTPLSRSGSNDISNIVWACSDCNRRKGQKTAEEFANVQQ